jgi:hypothetical protein
VRVRKITQNAVRTLTRQKLIVSWTTPWT